MDFAKMQIHPYSRENENLDASSSGTKTRIVSFEISQFPSDISALGTAPGG